MADEPTEAPPNCPKCGIVMRPATRAHGTVRGRAVPRDTAVNVWRCPACAREMPRGG
ncbi:MAG: hypothetical protein AB7V42_02315 [Thermoleophilia bacterium]